jgi:hypothetical protein
VSRARRARRRLRAQDSIGRGGLTQIRREAPPFEAARGGSDGDGPGAGAGGGHRRRILPARGTKDEQLISTTIAYASSDRARPLEAADHCSVRDRVTGLHCSLFFSRHTVSLSPRTTLRSVP